MNKQKLQQIAFNHLLDIDFKDFMNLYKICTAKLFSFLVIETTLASDNPLHFRKNLLEKIKNIRQEMKNCNMKLTMRLQKYQCYHQVKLINMNILQANK